MFLLTLVTTASHTNITANPNAASLLCDDMTQVSAGCQTRELLRAIDSKWDGLHLKMEVKECLQGPGLRYQRVAYLVRKRGVRVLVGILNILDLLIQVEAQAVSTLVAHR